MVGPPARLGTIGAAQLGMAGSTTRAAILAPGDVIRSALRGMRIIG